MEKTDVCTWWPDGKRMGYGVTYSSPNGSPGQGGRREKPNDWLGTLKQKWHLLPVSKKRKRGKLVVGQGSWRTGLKPRTPGKGRARKRFSTGIHLNEISNFGTVSPYTQFYIPSFSQFEEKQKKRKTVMFMDYSFMIYLTCWRHISMCNKGLIYLNVPTCSSRSLYLFLPSYYFMFLFQLHVALCYLA